MATVVGTLQRLATLGNKLATFVGLATVVGPAIDLSLTYIYSDLFFLPRMTINRYDLDFIQKKKFTSLTFRRQSFSRVLK